jgi:cyclophilin family peptidyl-prolyl cis-trans isomerase
MHRCGFILFVGFVLLGRCSEVVAADSEPAKSDSKQVDSRATTTATDAPANGTSQAESGHDSDFRELFKRWQAALTNLAQVQVSLRVSNPASRAAMTQQYNAATTQAAALEIQLQNAAEKAYAAHDPDPEIGQFLFTMALGNVRSDNYEAALRLAKLLIAGKYPDKDIYRIAATSAFATMEFDEAKKFLLAMGDGKLPAEPDLQLIAAETEHYGPLWKREQKLRQDEAKADNLPRVKLQTSRGDIVVELFEDEAPNSVANFLNLVEKGFYDGTQFHRVLPGFMAQVGDPLSKDPEKNKENIGKGGPGYTIDDEFPLPAHRDHFRGTLSMAHTAQPNSAGSQFFITFAPLPTLDGAYTAFGRVIDGMDVLSKLQRINPDHEHDRPSGVQPDKIIKAEVVRKRIHAYEPKTHSQ